MKNLKLKNFIKTIAEFLLNSKFLICFSTAWLITNGWSYALLGIGTYLAVPWMITVASAYLAFLWLPISPEKIVTIAIAIALLRFFFPNDQKTLGKLYRLQAKLKCRKHGFESPQDNSCDKAA